MNINKNITINLSEDDVCEIIADYCCRNGYKVKPDDVTLSVSTRCVGFGPGEHMEHYFAWAKVNVKEEAKRPEMDETNDSKQMYIWKCICAFNEYFDEYNKTHDKPDVKMLEVYSDLVGMWCEKDKEE
jgi:hypothetical protein